MPTNDDKTNGQTNGGDGGGGGADFTRKRVDGPRKREHVKIDHETGMIHVPGVGPLPLVGPTSGREYRNLQEAEKRYKEERAKLVADMKKYWKCVQCKRTWPGTRVRFKKLNPASEQVYYVCPDKTCDAPVIEYQRPER